MKKMHIIGLLLVVFFASMLGLKKYSLYFNHKSTASMYSSLEYFENVTQKLEKDYLIVGDGSIFTALNPTIIGPNVYSQAMMSNSLMDTYYLLRRTDLSKIKKGVIISNSFFSERNYETDFWKVMIPISYYNFNELYEIYQNSRGKKLFPATRYGSFYFWFKVIKDSYIFNSDDFEVFKSIDWKFDQANSTKIITDFRLNKFKGFSFLATTKKPARFFYAYHLHFNKFFYSNPTDDYYLKKILEILKDKKVYFIKTPLAKMAHPAINVEKFELGLENYIKSLKIEYNNLEYVNLDKDLQSDDFYNFFNLNIEGSKKFSRNLKNYLNE